MGVADQVAEREAYARGRVDGELSNIVARLDGHDRQFGELGTFMSSLSGDMQKLMLSIQHLADQADARDATAVALADALREAEDVRRRTAEDQRLRDEGKWTPLQRFTVILTTLIGVIGFVIAFLAVVKP